MVDSLSARGNAGGCRHGADAGEFRQGGFGFDPFGVVAGDDQDLCGGVDADAEGLDQLRGGAHHKVFDHRLEFGDLGVEHLPAPGQ